MKIVKEAQIDPDDLEATFSKSFVIGKDIHHIYAIDTRTHTNDGFPLIKFPKELIEPIFYDNMLKNVIGLSYYGGKDWVIQVNSKFELQGVHARSLTRFLSGIRMDGSSLLIYFRY